MGSPAVPRPVAAATGATFRALSRVRGARIFHPRGVGYTGTVSIEGGPPEYAGAPLFEEPGRYRALFRFSRAIGLPEPLPDALGLALRIVDAHGPGRHQDFLLVTSAEGPLLHHLLLPAPRGFFGQSYSSVLPYRIGSKLRLVGATPTRPPVEPGRGAIAELTQAAAGGNLSFRLALAPLAGSWRTAGRLDVGEPLDHNVTERLALTPWNTGPGIRPVGPLNGVRLAAYRGSQRGRGLGESEIR